MTKPSVQECTREQVAVPENVSVHPVKESDGKLRGHLIVIGSAEVVATVSPLLLAFGISPEGVQSVLSAMFLISPASMLCRLSSQFVAHYLCSSSVVF